MTALCLIPSLLHISNGLTCVLSTTTKGATYFRPMQTALRVDRAALVASYLLGGAPLFAHDGASNCDLVPRRIFYRGDLGVRVKRGHGTAGQAHLCANVHVGAG